METTITAPNSGLEQAIYFDRPLQEVCEEALIEKYAKGPEKQEPGLLARDMIRVRVAKALAANEKQPDVWESAFAEAQRVLGVIMGGRINSAAGTSLLATLINCFVEPIGDATSGYDGVLPGIYRALEESAQTMRKGGGVGFCFSKIRPRGAKVKGTGSKASGPLSYMKVFDRSCKTVESAGARRGAQMSILRIDHPDILDFIVAKREKGELTQFNMSVAVTDAFMEAKAAGEMFELVHVAEPSDEKINAGAYRRDDGKWVYEVIDPQTIWDAIMDNTYRHADPGVVFIDRVNQENNLYYVEVIDACNPCGEQFLPKYGCCCLGSIFLGAHAVPDPDSWKVTFCWATFKEGVRAAVRMLDDVLDVTEWPLEEHRKEAMAKRRIGLGFTGLGSLLCLMGLRYDRPEGRKFAAEMAEVMRDEAYLASIELAKEKGPFPLFDKEKYLNSAFVKRLPKHIRDGIAEHGIRNSHLLSIAPTGTISLAFADNASNGIEPAFSWHYTRNKRMEDGSKKAYQVMDHAYRLYVEDGGDPDNLPESFVNALEMSPYDHLAMVEAVAPFIDSAISKTINCPEDIPFDEFKDIYERAYKSGLKGITTYRPNDVTGAVLEVTPKAQAPSDLDDQNPDRKIRIDTVPTPALASLRWPSRPETPEGNPAVTYMVKSPESSFAVFVGHVENGKNSPFEVWVNGQEQPRGLGALAKALSMDMRSEDRGWLKAKLDALVKTQGKPFELQMPGNDQPVIVPSHVAALAKLVDYRCTQLGTFEEIGDTPLRDSMFALKEPKTGTDGTLSWSVDVKNPATGDDFVLFLKELVLPDGTHRPFSMWLAGAYPEALDGLCKALSIDMRVLDPAWIAKKLRSLRDFPEPQGDFLAKIPGNQEGKQETQPSTVAYIARLILHRYRMLGILDNNGTPVSEMGIFHHVENGAGEQKAQAFMPGKQCKECGVNAVIRKDGCDFCTACGEIGSCG